VFVKERCWVVFDAVEGKGEHLIESHFQFAPGAVHLDGLTARTDYDDANLLLQAAAAPPFTETHVELGRENPRGGWYSDSYGKIEPAPLLCLSVRTALPWRGATLLLPYRGKLAPGVKFTFDGSAVEIQHADIGTVRVRCSLPSIAGAKRE
jgi:hypothetical protein